MSKLAENSNYGRKSGKKQRENEAAWHWWATAMALLKTIQNEEREKLNALWSVYDT